MYAIIRSFAAAFAILFAWGCAQVPRADVSTAAQAKSFSPATNRANVYVYRNQYLGAAIRMAVTVDGQERGLTQGMTYLLVALDPGRHTITSQGQATNPLTLDVVAGQNYFVRQQVTHNFFSFTYHSRLRQVDEAAGQAGVSECELVVAAN